MILFAVFKLVAFGLLSVVALLGQGRVWVCFVHRIWILNLVEVFGRIRLRKVLFLFFEVLEFIFMFLRDLKRISRLFMCLVSLWELRDLFQVRWSGCLCLKFIVWVIRIVVVGFISQVVVVGVVEIVWFVVLGVLFVFGFVLDVLGVLILLMLFVFREVLWFVVEFEDVIVYVVRVLGMVKIRIEFDR